jgi:ATP-binding protein involved in chromosome partitioning
LIRAGTDDGKPSVVADPDSSVSQSYRQIARKLAANLWLHSLDAKALPDIEISDD